MEDESEKRYSLEELLDPTTELDIPPPPEAIGVGKDGEPRLIIEKIVNIDFKSYAGTKVIGPLHKAFTSIIGPNGSGKSNVIDNAVCLWLSSQQNPKQKSLRAHPQLGELSQRPPGHRRGALRHDQRSHGFDPRLRRFTRVKIRRLANCLQRQLVFVLCRWAKNDLQRGRRSATKERDRSRSQSFPDPPGRGRTNFSNEAKSREQEWRGYVRVLGDIIGSSRLKPFIEKLNNQVEQLNEHRTKRNNNVKLAEVDRNKLKDGFEEAKKWTELKNQLTRDMNLYYQAESARKEAHQKELTEENKQRRKWRKSGPK